MNNTKQKGHQTVSFLLEEPNGLDDNYKFANLK